MPRAPCPRSFIPALFAVLAAVPLTALCADVRTLDFAGFSWIVHRGYGGPGPNRFSDSADSVWVDDTGQLHLKIRRIGGAWYSSEVYTRDSLGYGTYRFRIASDAERYDPSIVVGLFTYLDDQHEIDIELTRQGNPHAPDGNYTVQPYYIPGNMAKFELGSRPRSTHAYEWRPDSIYFQSLDGLRVSPRSPADVLAEWSYTGNSIPQASTEKMYINFDLFQGVPPVDGADAELIVTGVTFTPAALVPAAWRAFAVATGALAAGDLRSVRTSDDDYLEVEAQPDASDAGYSSVTVFEGTTAALAPTRLDITLDASATGQAANGILQLYDYDASRFVTVGTLPLGAVDLRRKFEIPDPVGYVRASDGHVRARLLSRSSGAPHRLRVDTLRAEAAS